MKVKELLEKLQTMDLEKEVWLSAYDRTALLFSVELNTWTGEVELCDVANASA